MRSGVTLRWKVDDCRLGRSGTVMWKVSNLKVVALGCVG
jgi:hypothetical protein